MTKQNIINEIKETMRVISKLQKEKNNKIIKLLPKVSMKDLREIKEDMDLELHFLGEEER